jgi:hypothetical protein
MCFSPCGLLGSLENITTFSPFTSFFFSFHDSQVVGEEWWGLNSISSVEKATSFYYFLGFLSFVPLKSNLELKPNKHSIGF